MTKFFMTWQTKGKLIFLFWMVVLVGHASAEYAVPDLVEVPINRLTQNLAKQAEKNPKDFYPRFALARLHGMAYALKTETAQVPRPSPDKVWYGHAPPHIPFGEVPTEAPAKNSRAKAHLQQSLHWYREALFLAPENLTARLGYAWCLEKWGEKQKAIQHYRGIIREAWQKEKGMKTAGLGWHPVAGEAAAYLLLLLHPKKDQTEIADLKRKIDQLHKVIRPITPVVIPLRGQLTLGDIVNKGPGTYFDLDGSGTKQLWRWITPQAGWLVYDPDDKKQIDSALKMVGSVSFWLFWENGYEALRALDNTQDGFISGKELDGLAVWQDANSNGKSEEEEVRSLEEVGIVSLSCSYEPIQWGNQPHYISPKGIQFRDGSTRASYDILCTPNSSSFAQHSFEH